MTNQNSSLLSCHRHSIFYLTSSYSNFFLLTNPPIKSCLLSTILSDSDSNIVTLTYHLNKFFILTTRSSDKTPFTLLDLTENQKIEPSTTIIFGSLRSTPSSCLNLIYRRMYFYSLTTLPGPREENHPKKKRIRSEPVLSSHRRRWRSKPLISPTII